MLQNSKNASTTATHFSYAADTGISFWLCRRTDFSQRRAQYYVFFVSNISTCHMLMKIFFSRCQSPTDMTLWLIDIQYFPCFPRQGWIHLGQALCYVLMYRALTDSKLLCGLTHCRIVIYNVFGYFYGSFFYIAFQRKSPAILVFTLYAEDLLLWKTLFFFCYICIIFPANTSTILPPAHMLFSWYYFCWCFTYNPFTISYVHYFSRYTVKIHIFYLITISMLPI